MLPDFEGYSLPALTDPVLARLYLGQLLRSGQITLLLGAGISMSKGLPSWTTLVAGCEEHVGIAPVPGRSGTDLMRAIDTVRRRIGDPEEFRNVVWQNLYPEAVRVAETYPSEAIADPMLVALGALVMNSTRGSVSEVFTMNFDDLLEWYLEIHGFRAHVLTDFPSPLRADRDVAVFHPHGFVPLVESPYPGTPGMVFSYSDLLARIAGADGSRWSLLLESRLLSSHLLAVGTSLNDMDLDVLFARVRPVITDRPLGFVIVASIDQELAHDLLDRGIVPIAVGSHAAVPGFLLDICRTAAGR